MINFQKIAYRDRTIIIDLYVTIACTNKTFTCTRSHNTRGLIIFHCIFIEKPCILLKRVQLIMKVQHTVYRNFVKKISISETLK